MDQTERTPSSLNVNQTLKWVFLSAGILILLVMLVIAIPYWKLARRVDRQLAAGPFLHTYSFYAESMAVAVGDQESSEELVAALRRAGMHESSADEPQTFTSTPEAVIVRTST